MLLTTKKELEQLKNNIYQQNQAMHKQKSPIQIHFKKEIQQTKTKINPTKT